VALTVFPGEISKAGEQVYPNLVYFNDVDGGACFADWKARALREGARHGSDRAVTVKRSCSPQLQHQGGVT